MISQNILEFDQPGIYEIRCLVNQKVYVGETRSCLERLTAHVKHLKERNHDCLALQDDWNQYGSHSFVFLILEIGKTFQNETFRKQKEKEWIQKKFHSQEKLYNQLSVPNPYYQPILWNGVRYPTLKSFYDKYMEMYPAEKCSETTFRRRLQSKSLRYLNGDITWEKPKPQYARFWIEGQLYESTDAVIQAKLVKDRFQLYRRIQSSKYPNWKKEEKE